MKNKAWKRLITGIVLAALTINTTGISVFAENVNPYETGLEREKEKKETEPEEEAEQKQEENSADSETGQGLEISAGKSEEALQEEQEEKNAPQEPEPEGEETAENISVSEAADYSWYGDGTAEEYQIFDRKQLTGLANLVNGADGRNSDSFEGKKVVLMDDIDLSGRKDDFWIPIGFSDAEQEETNNSSFDGTFDGNGKQITGLCIEAKQGKSSGLFGTLGLHAVVERLGVFGEIHVQEEENSSLGGIAGVSFGTVRNSFFIGNGKGESTAGGIAGTVESDGRIENCYAAGQNIGLAGSFKEDGSAAGNSYVLAALEEAEEQRESLETHFYSSDQAQEIVNKSSMEFSSGEVAWLLNSGQEFSAVFGQRIGKDPYPVFLDFSDTEEKKESCLVYQLSYLEEDGSPLEETEYRSFYTNEAAEVRQAPKGFEWRNSGMEKVEAGSIPMNQDIFLMKTPILEEAESALPDLEETVKEEENETGAENLPTKEESRNFPLESHEESQKPEPDFKAAEDQEQETVFRTAAEQTELQEAEIPKKNGIYIRPIEDRIYTGAAQKPEVEVFDTGVLLKPGKDYRVKYQNHKNAGEGQVLISGKGNYSDTLSAAFSILPKDLTEEDMAVKVTGAYAAAKKAQTPIPVIKHGKRTLKKGVDFQVSYAASGSGIAVSDKLLDCVAEPGSYQMRVEGIGNYKGVLELPFEIVGPEKILMSSVSVKLNKRKLTYTGKPITADGRNLILTVKKGREMLQEGIDYTVAYSNNTEIGTAAVRICALPDSPYAGDKYISFIVEGKPVNKAALEGFLPKLTYTGEALTQEIVLKDGEKLLTEGTDYSVSYESNREAGTALLIVKGKNAYSGELRKKFSVQPAQITEAMITEFSEKAEQNKAGAKPEIKLAFGNRALLEGRDYTVSCKNNKEATSGEKKGTVTITGKGNFKGSLKEIRQFEITKKPFYSDAITIFAADMIYAAKKPLSYSYQPKITIYDQGKKLGAKEYTVSYTGNTQADIKNAVDSGKTCVPVQFTVYAGKESSYISQKAGTAYISLYSLIKAKVRPLSQKMYTGQRLELTAADFRNEAGESKVTLKIKGETKELLYGKDFIISSYAKSIFPGIAKATLKAAGTVCGGTKTVTFQIKPKQMKEYGTTIVRYVDENFKDITEPVVNETAQINQSYTFSPREFSGYEKIDTKDVTVTVKKGGDLQEVIFRLKKIIVRGTVTVKYVTESGSQISPEEQYQDLNTEEEHQISAKLAEGYTLDDDYVQTVRFSQGETEKTVIFHYIPAAGSEIYTIELDRFRIKNDGTNAKETTEGINEAIRYALKNGWQKIKLPEGLYGIDSAVTNPYQIKDKENKSWIHRRAGISPESNMQLDLTGCTLKQLPSKEAYTAVITISGCENTKLIGGTIIGDREDHYYGTRINDAGGELESGSFSDETGEAVADETRVRTKDFITEFVNEDGSEKGLPEEFYVMPLKNTSKNTVDGGVRNIFCYDGNGKYLGQTSGGGGFVKPAVLQPGTKKIKISFKNETRLDAAYYITEEKIYPTYEFGAGITVGNSQDVEIIGMKIKDTTGDCILTYPIPLKVTVEKLAIVDCELSGSRRQGISFVGTGENNLVKGTTIRDIAGIDPQCGIDFEHYDYCKNTVIDDCTFYNNKKLDIVNYNGTDIEIKNSRFSGLVGAAFGYSMRVHDNYFEYTQGQDKVHKAAGVQLQTHDNVVWNNRFVNANITVAGENSKAYGNHITGGQVTMQNNYRNVYENVEKLFIQRTEEFSLLEGSEFRNCDISVASAFESEFPFTIRNCRFIDSKFNARGVTNIELCEFENQEKPVQDGYGTQGTESNFYKCRIHISDNTFLQGGNRVTNFKECEIVSKRAEMLQYGITSFDDTSIKIVTGDSDKTKTIVLNKSGYGYEKCPWYFRNCSFEAEDPIAVYSNNGHDTNTAAGPVEFRQP